MEIYCYNNYNRIVATKLHEMWFKIMFIFYTCLTSSIGRVIRRVDTIEFARTIPVNMMKCDIAIAFPGTKMFNNHIEKGLIRSFDWDEYMAFTAKDLFAHENLSFEVIQQYMKKFFYRCILFNPSFIIRRILRGIRTGEFFWDAYYALKFYLLPTTTNEIKSNYYARERWPEYDFKNHPPKPANYQIVRKTQSKMSEKA